MATTYVYSSGSGLGSSPCIATTVYSPQGFWSRFFPAYSQLRSELERGSIGEVRALSVHFGVKFEESPTSRVINKEMGGGVALDIGCYAVQLANLVFNMERPEKIFVHGSLFDTGCRLLRSSFTAGCLKEQILKVLNLCTSCLDIKLFLIFSNISCVQMI